MACRSCAQAPTFTVRARGRRRRLTCAVSQPALQAVFRRPSSGGRVRSSTPYGDRIDAVSGAIVTRYGAWCSPLPLAVSLLASCLAPFFPRVLPTHTPAKACCKKQARAGGGVLAAPASHQTQRSRRAPSSTGQLERPMMRPQSAPAWKPPAERRHRAFAAPPGGRASLQEHLNIWGTSVSKYYPTSILCHGRPSTAATCTAVPHSSHASAILWRVVLTACHAVQAPRSCRSPPARASAPRTDDVRASPTHDYSRLN